MVTKKQLGLAVIVLAILMALLTISFTSTLRASLDATCPVAGTAECPHANNLPWQSYLSYTLSALLFALGVFIYLSKEESSHTHAKRIKAGSLESDEKKIVRLINDSNGTVFQSELVEKSGFDKVKVTRILDKLEGKGLIERRRRGMTNVVLAKQ